MKVVLFCGGLGMRMREYSEAIPKPMVPIGYRPILWHLMKYYAHFNHKDFILCLGHQGDVIKKYFLNYDECISNDFVLSKGGTDLQMLNKDIDDWKITFVDTGLHSNIGMRLKAVEKHLKGEEFFLANYADGLSDVPLLKLTDLLRHSGKTAVFVAVQPKGSFHLIESLDDGMVKNICHIRKTGIRVNGGFFVFRRNIFDYMKQGEELVEQPFQRLIEEGQLITYRHDGFWGCMDTFKEKQELDEIFAHGKAPWAVWNQPLPSAEAQA
jgi:glucose-1-phosphate cytidylyltransferase